MKRMSVFAGLVLLTLSTAAQASDAIANWAAPSSWTPPSTQATGRSALVTFPPLPFIPLSPCRLADIRAGSGFPAGYGPPAIVSGGVRNFTITGQCGIPALAQAVSFNFAVWAPTTRGDLRVYPAGVVPVPVVSTLNWEAGILALANAAVVPLSVAGAITVQNDGTTPLEIFIDVNGYYTSSIGASTFNVSSSSYFGILGISTTGFGLYGSGLVAGVKGDNTGGPAGVGVIGAGFSGIGVRGESTTNTGVVGTSSDGDGVHAFSTGGLGVLATSTNTDGAWALSTNLDGLFASGGRDGILSSGARFGVFGVSRGTTGQLFGVIGQIASTSTNNGAAGVRGTSSTGTSTDGFSTNYAESGVQGVTGGSSGFGVLGVAIGAAGWGGLFARQSTTSPFAITSFAGFVPSSTLAGLFLGDVSVTGTLSKGAGSFKIDHPLDPEHKYLYHSFVESPDMKNIYDGIIVLDALGEAIVELPAYFEALNSDFRYQLTSIGRPQSTLYIADEVQDLKFRIAGGKPHARVSWQVTGIRKDPFANANRIIPEVEKEPAAKGYYLHPSAYKQPAEKSLLNHFLETERAEAQEQAKQNNR